MEMKMDDLSFDKLQLKLNAIEKKVAKSIIKKGVTAGTLVLIKSARAKLPGYYSGVAKSIGKKNLRQRVKGSFTALVGHRLPQRSKKTGKITQATEGGWLGPIVEYGTLAKRTEPLSRTTKRKQRWKRRGQSGSHTVQRHSPLPSGGKAVPHIRPAYDQKGRQAVLAMEKRMWELVEAEIK